MPSTEIFKLGGKVYAFDSTTIDLCLSMFEWAFSGKQRVGLRCKLYDIEAEIPTFFWIKPAKTHDKKAMDKILYEENFFFHLRPWVQRLQKGHMASITLALTSSLKGERIMTSNP